MKTTNPKVITVTPTSGVIHPNKTEKLIVEVQFSFIDLFVI